MSYGTTAFREELLSMIRKFKTEREIREQIAEIETSPRYVALAAKVDNLLESKALTIEEANQMRRTGEALQKEVESIQDIENKLRPWLHFTGPGVARCLDYQELRNAIILSKFPDPARKEQWSRSAEELYRIEFWGMQTNAVTIELIVRREGESYGSQEYGIDGIDLNLTLFLENNLREQLQGLQARPSSSKSIASFVGRWNRKNNPDRNKLIQTKTALAQIIERTIQSVGFEVNKYFITWADYSTSEARRIRDLISNAIKEGESILHGAAQIKLPNVHIPNQKDPDLNEVIETHIADALADSLSRTLQKRVVIDLDKDDAYLARVFESNGLGTWYKSKIRFSFWNEFVSLVSDDLRHFPESCELASSPKTAPVISVLSGSTRK